MTTWNCAIIRNTAAQPRALVVAVTASAFNGSSEGDAVRQMFRNAPPLQGLAIVLAHQVGERLNLKGDSGLVSQLSRQAWNQWDWREVTIG